LADGQKKRKAKKWPKGKRLPKFIAAVAALALLVYAGVEIYRITNPEIVTRTALCETIEVPVSTDITDIYVVRDERVIEGAVSGTVVPLAADGERVARGADIAAVFQSAESAAKYMRVMQLRNEIRRYDRLKSQAMFSALKVGTLKTSAQGHFAEFLKCADNGDLNAAFDSLQKFRDDATSVEIATGGTLNLEQRKRELSAQIAALEPSVGEYKMVGTGAGSAGFYVADIDGHENVLNYLNAAKWTPDEIESALSKKQNGAAPAESLGKLVNSYKWYMAAVLPAKTAAPLTVGKELTIRFPHAEPKSVNVKVHAKNEDLKGRAAVIFVCSEINDSVLHLRREDAWIVLAEHTGYRVEDEAVRVVHNLYMEAVLDSEDAEAFTSGKAVTIRFSGAKPENVKARVYSKKEDESGKTTVVFLCPNVSGGVLRLRGGDAQVVLNGRAGFKVTEKKVESLTGVYVQRGNIASFRQIKKIYTGDGFILSDPSAGAGYVQMYDNIIVKGRNLDDGAVIA